MSSIDSKTAKIQTNFQALTTVASSLNAASDELTQVIGVLDEALKKLNVGLTVWEIFEDLSDQREASQYDLNQIGYCKVSGKWGIALRHIWGHEAFDDHREDGPWLFNDAPRELRLRGIDKIPEVIEALAKEAFNTTRRIQEKTKDVRELARAITSVTTEAKAKAKSVTLTERIQDELLRGTRKTTAGSAFFGELPEDDTKSGGK
jgi:prefoldin subunit 5